MPEGGNVWEDEEEAARLLNPVLEFTPLKEGEMMKRVTDKGNPAVLIQKDGRTFIVSARRLK